MFLGKSRAMLLLAVACVFCAALHADDKLCFENTGLKTTDTITLHLAANKTLSGTYRRTTHDESEPVKSVSFRGTRTGSILTIQFKGKIPYPAPKETEPVMWTMRRKILKVPMYGKNYETGKYSNYEASFAYCAAP